MLPRPRLLPGVALIDAVVHVLGSRCSERSVVKVRQVESLLYVIFELVKRFQFLSMGGKSLAAGSLKEHLITRAEQSCDLAPVENAGLFDFGLALPFVTDHSRHTALR